SRCPPRACLAWPQSIALRRGVRPNCRSGRGRDVVPPRAALERLPTMTPSISPQPRGQRRLAQTVLLAAAVLAVTSFPFRATWWGGFILAMSEAGIVGGLADWFAVTAIFRHPMGIPIPHTALIPANWQIMAARVGTMVGDRVLTASFVTREIERIDVAEILSWGAERLTRRDLEAVT